MILRVLPARLRFRAKLHRLRLEVDPVNIREMESRDIPAVCALIPQLTGETISPADMQNRLDWVAQSPIDWMYVAEIDDRVVGWMGFRLRECVERVRRYGEISAVVTDASVRGQGVGRALVDFAETLAHEHHCAGTWLVSGFARKDEAHRVYEHLGYQTTGYRFVKVF
jgi:GNAT superfamily N-acetyltransferase